jgi:hypothetical protein
MLHLNKVSVKPEQAAPAYINEFKEDVRVNVPTQTETLEPLRASTASGLTKVGEALPLIAQAFASTRNLLVPAPDARGAVQGDAPDDPTASQPRIGVECTLSGSVPTSRGTLGAAGALSGTLIGSGIAPIESTLWPSSWTSRRSPTSQISLSRRVKSRYG